MLLIQMLLRVGPFRNQRNPDKREMVKELLLASPKRPLYPSVACIYLSQGGGGSARGPAPAGQGMYLAFINKVYEPHFESIILESYVDQLGRRFTDT